MTEQINRSRPTMRDVAALAGVGLKTVSRVVNGEAGVSSAMTERVTRAARELDYRPDVAARSLRQNGRRTLAVGLLLGSVDNPFDAEIHRAVEDVAVERGIAVLAASTDEHAEREESISRAFTERRVDGMIITPTGADLSFLAAEMALGTPIVAIDRRPVGIEVDAILADNIGGARTAVEHLLEHGHERIAFLGDFAPLPTARERLEGGRQALLARGLDFAPELVVSGLRDADQGAEAMRRLLDAEQPPTAIFAARNVITTGAFRELQARGLQHRIAIVGFDDFAHADLLDPPITVIAQDVAGLGRTAAERLFARLEHPDPPVEEVVTPVELIVRGSCGCTPGSARLAVPAG